MSKRWKSLKMVLVLALAAVMLVSWVAFSAAKTVTITWGTDSKSGPSGFEMREDVIKLFEERNPGIKVKLQQFVGAGAEWQNKVTTQMVAGNPPDVISAYGPTMIKWMDTGQLLCLDEYFDEEFLKDFPAEQINIQCRGKDGHLYGVGPTGGLFALFYNKDLFDEAGVSYPDDSWDWDSLLEAAKKLTKKEAGKPVQYGYQVVGEFRWNIGLFIWQNGGEMAPKGERRATEILIDQPKALEAMEFLHNMVYKHGVAPTPAEMGDLKAWNTFLFNKVAMQINGYTDFKFNWEGADFNWDISRLPKGPVGRANRGSSNGVMVYRRTKYPEEAIKFLRFRVSPEMQEKYAREESLLPSRLSVMSKYAKISAFTDKINLEDFVADASYTRQHPIYTEDAKVYELLDPMLEKIFLVNKVSVREGITEICKKINEVLAKAK